jgi:hypothetical protein
LRSAEFCGYDRRVRALVGSLLACVVVAAGSGRASADRDHTGSRSRAGARDEGERMGDGGGCYDALDELGVAYERVRRPGIALAVKVEGPIGGIEYQPYREGVPLVLDCSLVYSLAVAGRFMAAHNVTAVRYSSAYERRNIRRTNRPSKHSFGLAIDIHTFLTDEAIYTVKEDYEQGLGDEVNCIGEPLTESGRVLRTLDCQLSRSELFRIVLTPDFDADHYNHFHVEVTRWADRPYAIDAQRDRAAHAAPRRAGRTVER